MASAGVRAQGEDTQGGDNSTVKGRYINGHHVPDITLSDIKKELDNIEFTLHGLETTKQTRIKPSILVSIALAASLQLGGAIYAFAQMDQQMKSVIQMLSERTVDRYTGSTAHRDFALRDAQIQTIRESLTHCQEMQALHISMPAHPVATEWHRAELQWQEDTNAHMRNDAIHVRKRHGGN